MNLPGPLQKLIRTVLYVAAGILPTLVLALLSLFLMLGGSLGILISTAAWAGTVGLVLALLLPPDRHHPRSTLWVCALLMLGLVAISPLLAGLSGARGSLFALICGPVLIALHYLWRAMRIFTARERRILGLILVLLVSVPGLFYLLRPTPPRQVIHTTAQTREISLAVEEGVARLSPSMGLNYVLKLPYHAIHYRGRRYRPLHHDAWISIPDTAPATRYLVQESLHENPSSSDWPHQVIWTVHDQQSGQLMARRTLWRNDLKEWSADTPSGWQGDNARHFIASVLDPGAPPVDWFIYPQIDSHSAPLPPTKALSLATVNGRVVGCNGNIELVIGTLGDHIQSLSGDWRFEHRHRIKQVFCLNSDIYVLSGFWMGAIDVDHLDSGGHPKGRFQISARAASLRDFRFWYASDLRAETGGLSLRLDLLQEWPTTEITRTADRTVRLRMEVER